jgi:hypothetical protein
MRPISYIMLTTNGLEIVACTYEELGALGSILGLLPFRRAGRVIASEDLPLGSKTPHRDSPAKRWQGNPGKVACQLFNGFWF